LKNSKPEESPMFFSIRFMFLAQNAGFAHFGPKA